MMVTKDTKSSIYILLPYHLYQKEMLTRAGVRIEIIFGMTSQFHTPLFCVLHTAPAYKCNRIEKHKTAWPCCIVTYTGLFWQMSTASCLTLDAYYTYLLLTLKTNNTFRVLALNTFKCVKARLFSVAFLFIISSAVVNSITITDIKMLLDKHLCGHRMFRNNPIYCKLPKSRKTGL